MMNEEPKLDERSLRIVALARSGVGGEKENARRILRQICEKKHLDFDTVLAGTNDEITERKLILGRLTKDEVSVIARVIMNFGMDEDHKTLNVLYYGSRPAGFAFECNKEARHSSQKSQAGRVGEAGERQASIPMVDKRRLLQWRHVRGLAKLDLDPSDPYFELQRAIKARDAKLWLQLLNEITKTLREVVLLQNRK